MRGILPGILAVQSLSLKAASYPSFSAPSGSGSIVTNGAWQEIPWTVGKFPSPRVNFDMCGRGGRMSHICDPEGLIPSSFLDDIDRRLEELSSTTRSPVCTNSGWQVYVAIFQELDQAYTSKFWGIEEAFRAFAASLGHQWGVLGNPCKNGVMVVYSIGNEYMVVQPDEGAAVARVFPTDILKHVARSALRDVRGSPREALATAVDKISAIASGNLDLESLTVDRSTIFLYVMMTCFGCTLGLMSLCCVYDTMSKWRHKARYHRCLDKIRRIHEVFLKPVGELPLCCACVDYLPAKPLDGRAAPNVVVFLCGHRLHTDCANHWFAEHPSGAGACPVCELPMHETGYATSSPAGGEPDDAKAFFLHSLQNEFPDIVSKEQVGRWKCCHTEIWLAELEQPRYKSIWTSEAVEMHTCEA
mmetsp:Transcript_48246/g.104981  ORF Transcript_48246/g.104981 Transcript_48246/m.104981 type:complete len:416 (-) Transcript_48246:78-1325(-)